MRAPALKKSTNSRRACDRIPDALAAFAAFVSIGAIGAGADADECPQPASQAAAARTSAAAPDQAAAPADTPIDFEADAMEGTLDGQLLLKGEVLIKQGERTLKTRDATYDSQSQSVSVEQDVEYSDPNLKVSGTSAHLDQAGGATFEGAKFELLDRNARGSAGHIQVTRDSQLKLREVRYTTCPIGEED